MSTDNQDADSPDFALPDGKSEDEFISEMRQRASWCFDAYRDLQQKAIEDVRFCDIPGHQWDEWTQGQRLGRPCYEFNKVRKNVQQITNDQRQNRTGIKVRASKDATEDLADIRMGLIRNIEATSFADNAYDLAFDFAVKGGFGAFEITTQYCDDDSFDQEIRIKAIEDPLSSIMFDMTAKEITRKDARYCFKFSMIPRGEFSARFPNKELVSFTAGMLGSEWDQNDWWGEQEVRIAQYWYKVPAKVDLCLMSDGSTMKKDDVTPWLDMLAQEDPPITIEQERSVDTFDVYSCVVSGSEILEKPQKFAGRNIPIIPVWGNLTRIEGHDYWCGEVRFQRDAQKLYNYERTTLVEVIAKMPKQPLFATAEAVEGYEADYEAMGHTDRPVLLYNFQKDQPGGGMPQRTAPPEFPVGLAQAAQMSDADLKSTSGVYDASAGRPGNEVSGAAINARARQGGVANYQYSDNFAKAKQYEGEILNELIPIIYDTEREIRIIGLDGADKLIKFNHAVMDPKTKTWKTLNDLSQGKFDIVVDTGPSYTTQRMEAAEAMSQLAQVPGPFQPLLQYGYLKTIDVPDMDDIKEAARMILVRQGILPPNEGDPPQPPQQPNPMVQSKAQLQAAQAAKASAEATKTHVETQIAAQAAPLEAQHLAAVTAKEQAHAISKIPPLPGDPTVQAPPNNATLALAPPSQM
jgi:hypothetical protein